MEEFNPYSGEIPQSTMIAKVPQFLAPSTGTVGSNLPPQLSPTFTPQSRAESTTPIPRMVQQYTLPVNQAILPPIAEQLQRTEEVPQMQASQQLQTDVEGTIRNYGYTPLARVMVSLANGQQQGLFIKALNPLGMLVFVHLDDGGQISVDKRDLTVIERGSFDMIPYSLKESSYKSAAPYARGIAITCEKGICVIHHDEANPGNLAQHNYEYQQQQQQLQQQLQPQQSLHREATVALQHSDKVMADDSLNVLPIVSLQDIKANHLLVLQHTEIATDRIAYLAHQSCLHDLNTFDQAYVELTMAAKQYVAGYQQSRALLATTTAQFREYARAYLRTPSRDPSSLANYNNALYNLRVRAEAAQELTRCCRTIEGYAAKLREITGDISALVNHCISDTGKYAGALTPR